VAKRLGRERGERHERRGGGGRGEDGSMPEQPVQVEAASAKAGEPVLQGQLADPDLLGDDAEPLALPQPRHRIHHDLDAGHLARENVAWQHPLPAIAALADRQRDGTDRERRDCVELA
jgi:hypothetical protein